MKRSIVFFYILDTDIGIFVIKLSFSSSRGIYLNNIKYGLIIHISY